MEEDTTNQQPQEETTIPPEDTINEDMKTAILMDNLHALDITDYKYYRKGTLTLGHGDMELAFYEAYLATRLFLEGDRRLTRLLDDTTAPDPHYSRIALRHASHIVFGKQLDISKDVSSIAISEGGDNDFSFTDKIYLYNTLLDTVNMLPTAYKPITLRGTDLMMLLGVLACRDRRGGKILPLEFEARGGLDWQPDELFILNAVKYPIVKHEPQPAQQ